MLSLASIKNSLDEVRGQYYPKNETERKVYEALSSANWGASSTLLNDIANESNDYSKYELISEIIWKSLDTDGKSWKQIFKSLTLIDFLIKNGSERFIEAARDRLVSIRRLEDYNFYEGTIDKGSGIREKAKQVVEMLNSNEIIRSEREKARALRNKFGGVGSSSGGGGGGSYGGSSYGGSSYSGSDSYGGNDNLSERRGSYSDRDRGSNSYSDNYGGGNKGRYGGDSYNDRSSTNTSTTNTGRYGGGAYDSDRPPRFGDDAPTSRYNDTDNSNSASKFSSNPANNKYKEEDSTYANDSYTNKPFKQDSETTTTTKASKLKVNIKKEKSINNPVPVAPVEVNLIEDDFITSSPITNSNNNPNAFSAFSNPSPATQQFDPFAPTPVVVQTNFSSFDAFSIAPVAPVPQTTNFDPFGMSSPSAAPVQVVAFDPFNQPQIPTQQVQYQQQLFASSNQAFPPVVSLPPSPALFNQQPQVFVNQQSPQVFVNTQPPPAAVPVSNNETDFGDFETASKNINQTKKDASSKWGDLGKLVDLGSIGKNEVTLKNDKLIPSNYTPSSFSGLDGFNKTPQSMASRPIGGMPSTSMGSINRGMNNPIGVPIGQPGMQMMGPPQQQQFPGQLGGMQMGQPGMQMMGVPQYPGQMGVMQMGQPGMQMMGAPQQQQQFPGQMGVMQMGQPGMQMMGAPQQQQQFPGQMGVMQMGQPGMQMMGTPQQQQQFPGQMGGAPMGNYGFQQQHRPNGW